ncbi:MAG: 4Fe-4S dicluster domain-containing protein, partial [Phycisphaerae bacterium]
MTGEDGAVEYRELTRDSSGPASPDGGLPRLSPKAAWFPRSEPVLHIRRDGRTFVVDDPVMDFPRVIVFGARPCDAAAPDILAPLFGWDYHDTFFEQRRRNTAFIVIGCTRPVDAACFCTTVGVDPAGEGLGDVLLTPWGDDVFLAEARTEVGESLLSDVPADPRQEGEPSAADLEAFRRRVRESMPPRFEVAALRSALARRFDDPFWERAARSCLACGTCAYVCPTCHCFDLQDEMVGSRGLRQKNWDACAFPLFTLHTSGHNPRPDQASRWRQRLSHKFRYYPEKFGRVLCTGCGRCLRLCPAGMDMLADLQELAGAPSRDREGAVEERTRPGALPDGGGAEGVGG